MTRRMHTHLGFILTSVLLAALAAGPAHAASKHKAQHGHGDKAAAKQPPPPPATSDLGGNGKPVVPSPTPEVRGSTDSQAGGNRDTVRRESHIEFDERMVRGQSASGIIYLFQRNPSEFKSIVQVPDSFRPRTVEVLSSGRERR